MKKIKGIVAIAMLLLIFADADAQVEKYQSLFIYNFSKYIKWPDEMNSGEFVIGVLGDSQVYTHLKEMAETKRQTQNMNIVVKKYNSASEIGQNHILFISGSVINELQSLSNSMATKSTLIITDRPGMALKGATINFIEDGGKIKFELNQANAEKRGLKVASSLTALSVLI